MIVDKPWTAATARFLHSEITGEGAEIQRLAIF
jgi:hypothetical protein